jgi:hypothetical protein
MLYERLLKAAEAAQAADVAPASMQAHLAGTWPPASALDAGPDAGGDAIEPIRAQILSRAMLTDITPPMPGETNDQLLARIAAGAPATMLELKLSRAGARAETVRRVQELRAQADVARLLLLGGRDSAQSDLDRLAYRLLITAEATAVKIGAGLGRPAEAVANDLLSRPSDLAQCDLDGVFDRDPYKVFGFLGHLSDGCRFGWRAA